MAANINKYFIKFVLICTMFCLLLGVFMASSLVAQEEPGNFSLQVTPSPIVESIKPGESKTIELKIRNNGNKTENLKIETRGFSIKDDDKEVALTDNTPNEISNWIVFANPKFTVLPGEWFTQRITFNVPKTAGFSYSFAFVLSRVQDATAKPGTPAIKGSVAVFTLLNIDRPDAKRELSVTSYFASKNVYEYLPVVFTTKFKNTGNTIVQPYGNIYIQRTKDANEPLAILPVNEAKGYILPNTERSLKTTWSDGFPVYTESKNSETGTTSTKLVWDSKKIDQIRIGKYYAKLVAVYNDGQRDVPIEGVISFWVIPWKIILIALFIFSLVIVGLVTIIKKVFNVKKLTKKSQPNNED